MNVYTPVVRH